MGVIYEKGDVYPCELLNRQPLGNVRNYDYDFRKLWASATTKKSAAWIKDSQCYCTHECFQRFNIIYNPQFVAKHLIKSMFGKSDLINSLRFDPQAASHGEKLVRIGKIRGVRVQQAYNAEERKDSAEKNTGEEEQSV
jgi:hypothetical protein